MERPAVHPELARDIGRLAAATGEHQGNHMLYLLGKIVGAPPCDKFEVAGRLCRGAGIGIGNLRIEISRAQDNRIEMHQQNDKKNNLNMAIY